MKMNSSFYNEDGLTLIELMIVMALSLLLMAAVYLTFQLQNSSGRTQLITSATQQDLRAAIETISWDIMHAGLTTDPHSALSETLSQGIPTDSSDTHLLRIIMDPPTGHEDITYRLQNRELQRVNNVTNAIQVLARNVTLLEFTYSGRKIVAGLEQKTDIVLAAGAKLSGAEARAVRFVKVRIEKDSDLNDPDTRLPIQRAIERTVCRRNGAITLME
jgi:prepilin-type N-terminal cleavage/methylation domain-containing protein